LSNSSESVSSTGYDSMWPTVKSTRGLEVSSNWSSEDSSNGGRVLGVEEVFLAATITCAYVALGVRGGAEGEAVGASKGGGWVDGLAFRGERDEGEVEGFSKKGSG